MTGVRKSLGKKSAHGITEKIISTNVSMKIQMTNFCRPRHLRRLGLGLEPQGLVARRPGTGIVLAGSFFTLA